MLRTKTVIYNLGFLQMCNNAALLGKSVPHFLHFFRYLLHFILMMFFFWFFRKVWWFNKWKLGRQQFISCYQCIFFKNLKPRWRGIIFGGRVPFVFHVSIVVVDCFYFWFIHETFRKTVQTSNSSEQTAFELLLVSVTVM